MPRDDPTRPWVLVGFTERFAAWVDLETIDEPTLLVVVDWIQSRAFDPYEGARREPGFPNLWWSKIRGSLHKGDEYVVICSYWIVEADHSVRCDNFGSAPWTV